MFIKSELSGSQVNLISHATLFDLVSLTIVFLLFVSIVPLIGKKKNKVEEEEDPYSSLSESSYDTINIKHNSLKKEKSFSESISPADDDSDASSVMSSESEDREIELDVSKNKKKKPYVPIS